VQVVHRIAGKLPKKRIDKLKNADLRPVFFGQVDVPVISARVL